jgi:hypothetical protein
MLGNLSVTFAYFQPILEHSSNPNVFHTYPVHQCQASVMKKLFTKLKNKVNSHKLSYGFTLMEEK